MAYPSKYKMIVSESQSRGIHTHPPVPPQEGLVKACEQVLWGALAEGQEKEGELATILWDLNICI